MSSVFTSCSAEGDCLGAGRSPRAETAAASPAPGPSPDGEVLLVDDGLEALARRIPAERRLRDRGGGSEFDVAPLQRRLDQDPQRPRSAQRARTGTDGTSA